MNELSKVAVDNITAQILDDEVAVTYGTEAFLSKDYAEAEKELLWPRVWQMAGRAEDIPNVGDYFTYEIADESILIVRTSADTIKAFYNVCAHRGRQLVERARGSERRTRQHTQFHLRLPRLDV